MLNLIRKSMNKSNQNQGAGDNSTNLQGQSITINNGISYSDAKQIALDVFELNFPKLLAEASTIATERAEVVTEKFF